tara:strand:- start:4570 stop:6384 length:1815 start_codon:yes stop_codon:yes gene_type:complete
MLIEGDIKSNSNTSLNDEIDLKLILECFLRNKKLISLITLGGIIFGILFSFLTKKTWQGEFQIVLEKEKNQNSLTLNNRLSRLAGFSSGENKIQTEVEILKSPSILMGIFEYVKFDKIKKNKEFESLRFNEWFKSFDIKLVNNTSILELIYKDKDKELIIPVLQKISNAYQNYSGSERLRRIQLGNEYFENQLNIYKKRSDTSLKKVEDYSKKYNINYFATTPNKNKYYSSLSLSSLNNISETSGIKSNITPGLFITDVEQETIDAENQLTFFKRLLEKLDSLENDKEIFLALSSEIEDDNFKKNIEEIIFLENKLSELKAYYKDNDYRIKDLNKKINLRVVNFNEQVRSFILQKIEFNKSEIASNKRPYDVILNFKRLLRQVYLDQESLNLLESNYINFSLDQARIEDPWKLITKPTLLPFPVAPIKKRVVFLTSIVGLMLGLSSSLIKEKLNKKIYSAKEASVFQNIPLISEFVIDLNYKDLIEEKFYLLNEKILSQIKNNLAVMILGDIDEDLEKFVFTSLTGINQNIKIYKTDNLKSSSKYENLILLAFNGYTTTDQLYELNENIKFYSKNFLGMIMLKVNQKEKKSFWETYLQKYKNAK